MSSIQRKEHERRNRYNEDDAGYFRVGIEVADHVFLSAGLHIALDDLSAVLADHHGGHRHDLIRKAEAAGSGSKNIRRDTVGFLSVVPRIGCALRVHHRTDDRAVALERCRIFLLFGGKIIILGGEP